MRILLRTPRLVLREFTEDDVESLVALDADPRVMRYISNGIATTREEITNDHLPAYLQYHRRGPDFGFWVAQLAPGEEFIGWFHLRPEPGGDPGDPELGYRIRHAYWGQGLATEGSRALIAHGFAVESVTRIHASTLAVNVASRRVMEKSGMHLVRLFTADWAVRIEGDEFGDVEYAISRS